jgi:hypothetical protein
VPDVVLLSIPTSLLSIAFLSGLAQKRVSRPVVAFSGVLPIARSLDRKQLQCAKLIKNNELTGSRSEIESTGHLKSFE